MNEKDLSLIPEKILYERLLSALKHRYANPSSRYKIEDPDSNAFSFMDDEITFNRLFLT